MHRSESPTFMITWYLPGPDSVTNTLETGLSVVALRPVMYRESNSISYSISQADINKFDHCYRTVRYKYLNTPAFTHGPYTFQGSIKRWSMPIFEYLVSTACEWRLKVLDLFHIPRVINELSMPLQEKRLILYEACCQDAESSPRTCRVIEHINKTKSRSSFVP